MLLTRSVPRFGECCAVPSTTSCQRTCNSAFVLCISNLHPGAACLFQLLCVSCRQCRLHHAKERLRTAASYL
eukprot:1158715-Pelagomonas_calceolata.AAC.6